jgi:hypothetical protein
MRAHYEFCRSSSDGSDRIPLMEDTRSWRNFRPNFHVRNIITLHSVDSVNTYYSRQNPPRGRSFKIETSRSNIKPLHYSHWVGHNFAPCIPKGKDSQTRQQQEQPKPWKCNSTRILEPQILHPSFDWHPLSWSQSP